MIGGCFGDRHAAHNGGHRRIDRRSLHPKAWISRVQPPAVKDVLDDPAARPGLSGDFRSAATHQAEPSNAFRGRSARRHARRLAMAEEAMPRPAHRLARDAFAPGSFVHRDASGGGQQRRACGTRDRTTAHWFRR
jgi:hypothetical protein